jgi:hypothetical protein
MESGSACAPNVEERMPFSDPPKQPLGVLRGLAAALGIIIMVLTGGCALLISVAGGINSSDMAMVLTYAGPPFIIGLLIFLAATRLGR